MPREETRPDPDALLARVKAEEQSQRRGRLKILLGYAAGTGKTFAMLEEAHQRLAEGVDVAIAYVDTHGRAETEALLEGLSVIPRRMVSYRGVNLPEMDLDAVLARRPGLALVDELAHTNAPGCRHPKRYQDVEELLVAGIDVYTTLNIQHLESLNDVVAQITGVTVRETVPDRLVDEADTLEMVDLPPPELLQRLRDGKVYVPEQARRAAEKFFRTGNLTALRELALRRTASRVDEQMRHYMRTRAIPGPWPAGERLMVCVSASPLSERLVRATRRLADDLGVEWHAVHVETPDRLRSPQGKRDRVTRVLHLAEELGARAITQPGDNVADTVVAYARAHNVTKIVIGKPLRSRWVELARGSVVDALIDRSGEIDVYVISGHQDSAVAPSPAAASRPRKRSLRPYAISLLLVAAVSLLSVPVNAVISPANLSMFYLAAVVVAALYLGRGPAVLAALVGVLALDFLFVPPRLTLNVADTEYVLTFVGLLVVGVVVSSLTAQVRDQVHSAQRREAEALTLYEFSRDLASAIGLDGILPVIIRYVRDTFGREAVVLMMDDGILDAVAASSDLVVDEDELAVASWSYRRGEPAGRGTDTLPSASAHYLPLKTARGVVGVLGVRPPDQGAFPSPERRRLLEVFASLAALAIERSQLAGAAHEAEILKATERLQSALLDSISHDLRTPLVTITGALTALEDDSRRVEGGAVRLNADARGRLLTAAREEAEHLNRLVGNLLDITRLEAGAIRIALTPVDVEEIVGSALERMGDRLADHPVAVSVANDTPAVPMDATLMVQVVTNLLDNAAKHSPPGSEITVGVTPTEDGVAISVADRGLGVPDADLDRIFEKFHRVQRSRGTVGTGLGLAICKGFVEAHGGSIGARNRPGGGLEVTVRLSGGAVSAPAKENGAGM